MKETRIEKRSVKKVNRRAGQTESTQWFEFNHSWGGFRTSRDRLEMELQTARQFANVGIETEPGHLIACLHPGR